MSSLRAKLELMSEKDILTVISKDAPNFSTNTKVFIQDNSLTYYLVINTWLYLIKQYSSYGWVALSTLLTKHGLVYCIKEAAQAADELVHEVPIHAGIFSQIMRDVRNSVSSGLLIPLNKEKNVNLDPNATMLALLRYPKRITPVSNDITQANSIQNFLNVENRSKLLQRRGYSEYHLRGIKEVIENMLPWDKICTGIESILADPYEYSITGGASYSTNASLGSKLVAISKTNPEAIFEPFGFKFSGSYLQYEPELWASGECVRPVKVLAVPKSYKASRIIAMEDPYRQAKAKSVFLFLDTFLPQNIKLHDQTQNQELSRIGSITGDFATIDLSNASDTITKLLFREIFPRRFVSDIDPLLGSHTEVDGKRRVMQQMSTAGNSLTFILESIVFYALCEYCTQLYEVFSGEEMPREVEWASTLYSVPSVYGDDQVIMSEVVPTYLDVMKDFGFIVNEDKSFSSGKYRESCGLEFFDGVDVSGIYYPRFPITGTLKPLNIDHHCRRDSYTESFSDSLTSAIELQHRLFGVCVEGSTFLREVIKECCPDMTYSNQDSLVGDCWDYDDTFVRRYGPGASVEHIRQRYGYKVVWKKFSDKRLERKAKYRPRVRYNLSREVKPFEIRLFQAYSYLQFLKYGPRYDDPFLKLLGISSRPTTVEEAFGKPEVIFSLSEVDYE